MPKIKINLDDLNPRGLEAVIASPKNPLMDGGLLGIDETKDFAHVWFAAWEAYVKSMENGTLDLADLLNLVSLGILIPSAISGGDMVTAEIRDLALVEELPVLVAIADNYSLGNLADRAKDALVTLLYGFKTVAKTPELPTG